MRPRTLAILAAGLVFLGAAVIAVVAVIDGPAGARERVRDRLPSRPHLTPAELPSVACPARVPGCRSVRGRVVYVERVDPDGDGDLHVVLVGRDGVTGPGITAVDVPPALRPAEDPAIGDSVAAAGPVQSGSHGQRQVHALRYSQRK
jgi:hypothetical protein